MTYDVIVLGVGGMGSATVHELARRGRKVLGIEQFHIGHDQGSSHGVNRIIRLAYAESPAYVPLLRRAYQLWRELEFRARERLLMITGGLDVGPADGVIVPGSVRSCEEHCIPHEVLDAAEVRRRFPGFQLPAPLVAVHQVDAGFVLSERAILANVAMAQELGAEVHACEPVVAWGPEGNGVAVHTERDTYRATRLVITAGAWVGQAVPELSHLAVPERQVLIWTQPLRPELFEPGAFPIFNFEAEEGRLYGFPVYGVPGFKFGNFHHLFETGAPKAIQRDCDLTDERHLRAGIARYFPDANGPTLAMKACIFTNVPDEHFVLDRHPEFPQVSIASPCSGHGYKFAPVVGEIMADFALEGGCTKWDLSLFRLNRFAATPPAAQA
ncbi:MAG TPA: N-methyl-L-tryptophan oxidase [Candidatus Solibacter sp.]|nr:N-methyl-L-tryptophan oxidase [Candidatus Solibacter sp.]